MAWSKGVRERAIASGRRFFSENPQIIRKYYAAADLLVSNSNAAPS
jgi:hypothetical protein